jgi:hypothetical protein
MGILYAPPKYSEWDTACDPSLAEATRAAFGLPLGALAVEVKGDSLRCNIAGNGVVVNGDVKLRISLPATRTCSTNPYAIDVSVQTSRIERRTTGEAKVYRAGERIGPENDAVGPATWFSAQLDTPPWITPKEFVRLVPCTARDEPRVLVHGTLRPINGAMRIDEATWLLSYHCAGVRMSCELQSTGE